MFCNFCQTCAVPSPYIKLSFQIIFHSVIARTHRLLCTPIACVYLRKKTYRLWIEISIIVTRSQENHVISFVWRKHSIKNKNIVASPKIKSETTAINSYVRDRMCFIITWRGLRTDIASIFEMLSHATSVIRKASPLFSSLQMNFESTGLCKVHLVTAKEECFS